MNLWNHQLTDALSWRTRFYDVDSAADRAEWSKLYRDSTHGLTKATESQEEDI